MLVAAVSGTQPSMLVRTIDFGLSSRRPPSRRLPCYSSTSGHNPACSLASARVRTKGNGEVPSIQCARQQARDTGPVLWVPR